MKTALLISGGVDSSVALRLLKAADTSAITAFYLKIWLEDELSHLGACPWEEDLEYLRAVCDQAQVPLEVLPLQREYWDRVVSYTIAELRRGRTPSPDILCNQRIKYGAFVDAIETDFDWIASGHYARVQHESGGSRLLRSVDPVKDQTYFLSHLNAAQLARCQFPIGHLSKVEVRRLAEHYELANRDRPDSQGICFLGRIRFEEFVRYHLGDQAGPIIEIETGRTLGEHRGYWFHTIGQRRGLKLSQGPWFVVDKDCERNIVYVSHAEHLAEHECDQFEVGQLSWLRSPPALAAALEVKIRHSPTSVACRLEPTDRAGTWTVQMARADSGVSAGQFAVFYDGEECLGGGVIERALKPKSGTSRR
ncbi:MAG: tRNA 2-thiouridine(34) synthase MnmA [Planctomycetota bacterium]